ncbi:hypothetical protein [Yersinia kristensenii]|uniref:Uncharacterized protein n=1 Tax=Yersinia kristensenii TaxID=28152 RepID=A0AB73NLK6_YERKR|nr:hypothetical protein [Yersinia kristensenii]OVZ82186.1 hypothetical protein CBW52_05080 [Yersinia kristensenii]
MPTVPTYQRQTQTEAAEPQIANIQYSPDNFGAGLAQVADRATNIFAQEKAKYDDSQLQDSVLKLNAGMQSIQTEQNQLQGQNAMGSAPAAIQKYHELAGEIGITIPENRRRDWQRQVEGGALQLNGVTERHEFNQIQQYRQGQQQAIIANGVTSAEGLYADPVAYKLNGARTRESIQTYGQSQGWSSEEIRAKQDDFTQKSALAAANALNGADYTAMLIQNGEPSDVAGSMRVPRSEQYGGQPGKIKGMSVSGNINLYNRPKVKNEDGSISTVRTISIESDGKEVLIPTVSDDGQILSDDDAIALFEKTGKHLGMFDNADDATAYAESLHNDQAKLYTSTDSSAPRGIRNNNPGNIEFNTNNEWQGQTGSDGRFAKFETPEHGIRALGKNLLSYQRQGYETPEQIIGRWAPPGKDGKENDTDAYIKKVCADLGVTADQPLDLTNIDTLTSLCASIMKHENGAGKVPFTPEQVSTGVQAALGFSQLDSVSRVTKTPYFNELDASTQAQVLRHADAMRKEQQSQFRVQTELTLKDAYAAYDQGLQPNSIPSRDQIMASYGFNKGQAVWQELQQQQQFGGNVALAKTLSPDGREKFLQSIKPLPEDGTGYAQKQQLWERAKTKFNEFDKEWDKNQGRVMVSNALNNGVALDPSNKSNKDAADSFFDNQFANFNINDNNQVNSIASFVTKTGIVPTRLSSVLNAASVSKDSKVAIQAAELVSRIYDSNPAVLSGMPSEKQSFYLNAKRLRDAGVDADKSVEQAYDLAYNQTDAIKAQLASEQGSSSYRKDRLSAASSFVSDRSQFLRIDPSVDDSNPDATRFRNDYESLYDLNFRISGGDPDIAKKMTHQQVSRTWSISEVNGKAQMMKYAPEALYKGGPEGWQSQQWEEEKHTLIYGEKKGDITTSTNVINVTSGRPTTVTTTTPERKIEGDVILVPDVSTPRNGDYAIMISGRDKDGVPTAQAYYDKDGRPLRYKPDLQSWKPYQEMLSGQNSNIEQTMKKARERRGFYDSHREFDTEYKEAHKQRIETQENQLENYFKWSK